ncbi:hypothetical protein PENSPDRAFT_681650 [Peniophora sp. CONT]|nr:hypothetical protein PENSPDRAFT_681650 [Peniophora sp. CONT]
MVDWTSPQTLFIQAADWNNLVLVFSGIYIYEFACSIQFDWMLMTRDDSQRSLLGRSVKWILNSRRLYKRSRVRGIAWTFALFTAGESHQFDPAVCGDQWNSPFVCKSVCVFATEKIVLYLKRPFSGVVWNWNKWVTAAFTMAYTAVIALGIRAVILIKAVALDIPLGPACAISGVEANLPNIFTTLLVDVAVLILLFVGLRRPNWSHARTHNLWHLLWHQGLLYLTLAIFVEIPLTVFLFLNLNELMSLFFDAPFTVVL